MRKCRFSYTKWVQSLIVSRSGTLLLALLLIPACNHSPELNSPSEIQLHVGTVDSGSPFVLQVTGNNLDDSTRAVLLREVDNRSQLVGHLPLWGTAYDIELQGNYAYIANNTRGLVVVDISNMAKLEIVASADLPGKTMQVAPHGALLVTANENSGIHLVDISAPTVPRLVSTIDGIGRVLALDIADNLLFAASYNEGMFVIDISNRQHPLIIAHLELPERSLTLKRVGGHVYVGGVGKLSVVDVSDPKHPILLNTLELEDNIFDIKYASQCLYVTRGKGGLLMVDISHPDHLQILGQIRDVGLVIRFEIAAGRAYLASSLGLIVLDLQGGANGKILGGVVGESRFTDLAIRDGMVLATENTSGLEVFDLRQPLEFGFSRRPKEHEQVVFYDPQERKVEDLVDRDWFYELERPKAFTINRFDRSHYFASIASSVIQQGALAYIGTSEGIQTLDMSQLGQPRLIDATADGNRVDDLVLVAGYLYAAGGDKGLLIYHLDTAGLPVLSRVFSLPGVARALTAKAGLVYLVQQHGGMFVIDVNDPSAPRVLAHFQHPYPLNEFSSASHIILHHGLAYIADGPNGLLLVDVTDPREPTIKAVIKTADSARHLFIRDELLSVADARGGLQFYDVSVAAHPVFIGRLNLPGSLTASAISDDTLAVAAKDLHFFWLDKPVEAESSRLLGNNRMEFSFPAPLPVGRYTLRVFNAVGGAELVGAVRISASGEGAWQN